MWGFRSVIRLCRWSVSLLLAAAAAIGVPVALRERATADFLADLGRTPGFEKDTGSGPYYGAFWFDLAVVALLILIALAVLTRGGRVWFALAGLLSCFTAGVGVWALSGARVEVATTLPMTGLTIALITLAGLAAVASTVGWAASSSAEAWSSVRPMIPPVPPSHQAG